MKGRSRWNMIDWSSSVSALLLEGGSQVFRSKLKIVRGKRWSKMEERPTKSIFMSVRVDASTARDKLGEWEGAGGLGGKAGGNIDGNVQGAYGRDAVHVNRELSVPLAG